jgi:cysteine synthase
VALFASAKPYLREYNKGFRSIITELREFVGNTPITRLDDFNRSSIFAKLEYFNPFSYSVKDRTAAYLLTGPLERGEVIRKNGIIWIEASSGNLGIAYGKIGKILGLKTMVVTPSIVGESTFKRIKSSTSISEITPGGYCPRGERDGAIRKVMDTWMSDPGKYIWRDQYSNEDNILAHKETTGPEIWQQTNGKITTLVMATGTGGSIIGSGLYLKKQNPKIQIVGVQPQAKHHIQGVRNYGESLKPLILERHEDLIDEWIEIDDREAFEATKMLWRKGFPVGTSSGLNYAASRKIAKKRGGSIVVTLFPDIFTNSFKIMQNFISNGKIEDLMCNILQKKEQHHTHPQSIKNYKQ